MPILGPGLASGGGGGGLVLRNPVDRFTGADIAACRTARNTYFAATANAAALAQFQGNQSLAIHLSPTTGSAVFETYEPGEAGNAHDATKWLPRTDAVQGTPGAAGARGYRGISDLVVYQAATSAPAGAPSGGEYDVATGVLTPPTGAVATPPVPADGETVYASYATVIPLAATGTIAPNWSNWQVAPVGPPGTGVTDSDDVPEGSSNLYYTDARADARADARIAADEGIARTDADETFTGRVTATEFVGDGSLLTGISSGDSGGVTSLAAFDTDDLDEGSSNLYYTDARVDARISASGGTGTGLSAGDRDRLERIPDLAAKTQDLDVTTIPAWADTESDSTVRIAITQSETEPTAIFGLTFVSQSITITAGTAGDYWLLVEVPADQDPRDYRVRAQWPASHGGIVSHAEVGGHHFTAGGNRYFPDSYRFVDGMTLTLQRHTSGHVSHFRGETDADQVQVAALDERLADAEDVQAALAILDDYVIEDVTDAGALPLPAAAEAGKIFVDRVRKTAMFLVEDRIAGTAASGTLEEYDDDEFLGTYDTDLAASAEVANTAGDVNKFYWHRNRHIFRYWNRTEVTPGTFSYHFSDVYDPATFLAAREGFDHSADDVVVEWAGHASTAAALRSRIPADIADGSRVYGVLLSSGGIAGIRKIDGADFTAAVSPETHYSYGTLSPDGASTAFVDAAIAALRTELRDGVASNRDTLAELSAAINASVSNDALGDTASAESNVVAPSRRQVVAAIDGLKRDRLDFDGDAIEVGQDFVALVTSAGFTNEEWQAVDFGEPIDGDADYQFVFNVGSTAGPSIVSPEISGSLLQATGVAPAQANAPSGSSTVNAVDLKTGRPGANTNYGLFSHDEIYFVRGNANTHYFAFAHGNADSTEHTITVFKKRHVANGPTHSRVKGADVVLGGTTAGEAAGTVTDAAAVLLGYAASVTSAVVAHASNAVTLTLGYTTRAPAASLRPDGIDFIGERWLVADATVTVTTADGLSTISAVWQVPAHVASTAAEVEALRGTTARALRWLIAREKSVRDARLPDASARTENGVARWNATTGQWEMAGVSAQDQTSQQQDLGTYTRQVRAISNGNSISAVGTGNRYDGTLGDRPSVNQYNILSVLKNAIERVQVQVRVQNRFDVFLDIPRELIMDVGFTNATAWLDEWHASNSTVVPAIYVEWLHATGAENRGMPIARPQFFHINAARQSGISSFLLFFRHHAANDDDLRGIGIVAVSDSSLRLERAEVIFNSAIEHAGT